MEHYRLILEYDGTSYHGWQYQPNLITIQGIVEDRLSQITKEQIRVRAAGRTDAGVHAKGQVISFFTNRSFPPDAFLKGLNSLLPQDIVVREAESVSPAFDSRYSAKAKLYCYYIDSSRIPSPFWCRYSLHIPFKLNFESISTGANYLVGQHDFTAFRASTCSAKNPVRTIEFIRLEPRHNIMRIAIKADGFLHYMARNIVGTLIEVGRGKLLPEDIYTILLEGKREKAGPTAPACGLFLQEVFY